jgi:hypothetical protein
LGQLLSKGEFVKAFKADPDAALKANGVTIAARDREVLDVLTDLSVEELQAISRLKSALNHVGASQRVKVEMV